MSTLTESMNMKEGEVSNAYALTIKTTSDINYYETLCLICAELNTDLSSVSDDDFYSASLVLEQFCKNALSSTYEDNIKISVWFD